MCKLYPQHPNPNPNPNPHTKHVPKQGVTLAVSLTLTVAYGEFTLTAGEGLSEDLVLGLGLELGFRLGLALG